MDGIELDDEQFDTTDYDKLMSFNHSAIPEMHSNPRVVRLNIFNHPFDLFHLLRFEPFQKHLSNDIYGSYRDMPTSFMFLSCKKTSVFHNILLDVIETKFQSRCQSLDVNTKQLNILNTEENNIINERYNRTRELVDSKTLENPYHELLRSQKIHRKLESTAVALTDINSSYNLLINELYSIMTRYYQTEAEIHYYRQRLGLQEYLFATQDEEIAKMAWQAIQLSIRNGEQFDGSQWINNTSQCRTILLNDLGRLDKVFKRCVDIAYDIIKENQ